MPQTICARFAAAVRRHREARGWSQELLAAEAQLNRSYTGEIERALVVPSLATAAKLAEALDLPLSALIAECECECDCGAGGRLPSIAG